MNSVSRSRPGKIPAPSILKDELAPAASMGLGGLALDTPWFRGPVTLVDAVVGIEALSGQWRTQDRGPFRWATPAMHCQACLDGHAHADNEVYWPARHYREIAASFLRLVDDDGVLEFGRDWGLIRLHGHKPHRVMPAEPGWAKVVHNLYQAVPRHDGRPDLIDEVLLQAAQGRRVYEAAYSHDEAERRLGYAHVVTVIQTMETQFAPGSLAVQAVPTSLLHLVYFAIYGLYQGAGRLVCAEWLASGCKAQLPTHRGAGRPRIYCSDRCAWRARNRRRAHGSGDASSFPDTPAP